MVRVSPLKTQVIDTLHVVEHIEDPKWIGEAVEGLWICAAGPRIHRRILIPP